MFPPPSIITFTCCCCYASNFIFHSSFAAASEARTSGSLLSWQAIHQKMPWSLVFLLGGGFALAKACSVSGLSALLGQQLEVLDGLPRWVMVLVLCLITAGATEVTSNVATCSILLPVLKNLAVSLKIHPVYLLCPVTLACSYAFMLPVATPPNAIVYSASGMSTSEMVCTSFFGTPWLAFVASVCDCVFALACRWNWAWAWTLFALQSTSFGSILLARTFSSWIRFHSGLLRKILVHWHNEIIRTIRPSASCHPVAQMEDDIVTIYYYSHTTLCCMPDSFLYNIYFLEIKVCKR